MRSLIYGFTFLLALLSQEGLANSDNGFSLSKEKEIEKTCKLKNPVDDLSIEKMDPKTYTEEERSILNKFPQAHFYYYTNHVGNYRPFRVADMNGEKFCYRKESQDYIEKYKKIQDLEHRPPIAHQISDIILIPYMGSKTIAYNNIHDLALLAQLQVTFSLENPHQFIDHNAGNLVIKNGKLFYVDQTLSYCSSCFKNKEEVLRKHFSETLFNISDSLEGGTEHDQCAKKLSNPYLEAFNHALKKDALDYLYDRNICDNFRGHLTDFTNFFGYKCTHSGYLDFIERDLRNIGYMNEDLKTAFIQTIKWGGYKTIENKIDRILERDYAKHQTARKLLNEAWEKSKH